MKKPTQPRATRADRATRPFDSMAHRRTGMNLRPARPDNDPKVVYLKAWEKSSITPDDYDFTALADWPKKALEVAFCWELDRELGSGRGPFYVMWQIRELRQDRDPKAPMQPTKKLHSHSIPEVSALYQREKGRISDWIKEKEVSPDWKLLGDRVGGAYTRIHALEIDWRETESKLVDAFRNWLRHGDHDFRPKDGPKRGSGRRNTKGLISFLRDLAIYRMSVAGIERKGEGAGAEMLEKAGMLKARSKGELITSANWIHAKDKTEKRIQERIGTLCQCSEFYLGDGDERRFWKDCFVGMDGLNDGSEL